MELEAEAAAFFGIRQREGRSLTKQEYRRVFHLIKASHLIEGILDRHAKRQRRIAGSPPPQPPVIAARPRPVKRALLPRRARIRRTSAPLVARTRRGEGARTSSAKEGGAGADPDPAPTPPGPPLSLGGEGDPARILGRFARTRAWSLLTPAERRQIVALINGGLTPQAKASIDGVFQQSAINHANHPGVGELFFWVPFPTRGLLIRNDRGLLRILQFDPDSSFGDDWKTEGEA